MKGSKTLLSYLLFLIGLQWKTVYALASAGCDDGEFKCSNNECIRASWKCDGENDCGDNSDELNCQYTQPKKCVAFTCGNGQCIPHSWTCDSTIDCRDGSDEASDKYPYCLKSNRCRDDSFKCVTGGQCLRKTFRCDGIKNCEDGSDEENCDSRICDEDQFQCNNRTCISKEWHCNNINDCGDASDETNCTQSTCPSNEFQCETSKHCIRAIYRCDSEEDCTDGSDERGCGKDGIMSTTEMPSSSATSSPSTSLSLDIHTKVVNATSSALSTPRNISALNVTSTSTTLLSSKCNPSVWFICPTNKECIHKSWLCDGAADCPNGEDESNEVCTANTCVKNEFRCDNGKCIDGHRRCNGGKECPDGSDEKNCGKNECKVNNGGCDHSCIDLEPGFVCSCKDGYHLAPDKKSCVDIDECKIPKSCTQVCVNTKGGFTCDCHQGYSLDPVGKKICRANAPTPFLVFTNSYDIREMSTNDLYYNRVIPNTRDASAVSVDVKNNMIYWIDTANKTITRAPRTSSSQLLVEHVVINIQKPDSLAVDWIGQNLYWIDSYTNQISVSNVNGSHTKTFIQGSEEEQLHAVAVYPELGFIYWATWGNKPTIQRANLDGSNHTTIINNDHVTQVVSIAIDNTLLRIFWTDNMRRHISSSALDGSDIHIIMKGLTAPYGLAVFEEFVYWTDSYMQSLSKANKFDGSSSYAFKHEFFKPKGIAVFHPLAQKDAYHPCQDNNGNCSHFCFVSSFVIDKFSCGCPDFMTLDIFGRTCIRPSIPVIKTPMQQASRRIPVKYLLYIVIPCALVLVLVVILILVYRRKRSRFDLRMVYETESELIHTKHGKAEIEVKYVTAQQQQKHGKHSANNFENINHRPESKLLQMNCVVADECINDYGDSSSEDVDFDDTSPIV